jgi:hypothetical protein
MGLERRKKVSGFVGRSKLDGLDCGRIGRMRKKDDVMIDPKRELDPPKLIQGIL